jgi:hypothetical protein
MHFIETFQSFQQVYPPFLQFFDIFLIFCRPPAGNPFFQKKILSIKLSPIYENPVKLHHLTKNIISPIFERSSWSPYEPPTFKLNFSKSFLHFCNYLIAWPPIFSYFSKTLFHIHKTSTTASSPFFKKHLISPSKFPLQKEREILCINAVLLAAAGALNISSKQSRINYNCHGPPNFGGPKY